VTTEKWKDAMIRRQSSSGYAGGVEGQRLSRQEERNTGMMTMQQRLAVISMVALAVLAGPLGMMANAALVTQHDSEVGVAVNTIQPTDLTWSNQVEGGSAALYGQFSATPAVIAAATPLGQDALRFDGASSNPDQLKFGATNLFDSAPSLTFMMVVKPTTSATDLTP
jgi:hypothetical protein